MEELIYVQIFEATGNWWAPYIPLCEDTINIAQGQLSFSQNPPIPHPDCQYNTINLENIVDAYLINGGSNTEYVFTDLSGNIITDGTAYYIASSGITTIGVKAINSNCDSTTTLLNIDAVATSFNLPSYTISDYVIQWCASTDVTFSIDTPILSLSYSWIIDGLFYKYFYYTEF